MTLHVPAGPAPRANPTAALDALRREGSVRIPHGLTVQGEAHYPCDVAIEGTLEGTVVTDSILLVVTRAQVNGRLVAGDAYIEGSVDGQIDCSNGAVEFAPTARCKAQVRYRELSVARGADVEADLQQVGGRHG